MATVGHEAVTQRPTCNAALYPGWPGAAVLTAAGTAMALRREDGGAAAAVPPPGATASITRGDLIDTKSVDGRLTYAGERKVGARSPGPSERYPRPAGPSTRAKPSTLPGHPGICRGAGRAAGGAGWALGGAPVATLVVGMLAGLYPAVRAARLSPTVALSST